MCWSQHKSQRTFYFIYIIDYFSVKSQSLNILGFELAMVSVTGSPLCVFEFCMHVVCVRAHEMMCLFVFFQSSKNITSRKLKLRPDLVYGTIVTNK